MSYEYHDEKGEHLHTLDNKPLVGTSSVMGVINKPLSYWASGEAVKVFGCPDPKVITKMKKFEASLQEVNDFEEAARNVRQTIITKDLKYYMDLIGKAYSAHASTLNKKAKQGTDLHAELERFVKDEMAGKNCDPQIYDEKIHKFISWSRKNVKRYLWSESNCYSRTHWLGGISDAGFEAINGKFAIMDFKSSKDAYLTQFWQCAGYDIQISENGCLDSKGRLLYKLEKPIDYYVIVPFGKDEPYPVEYVNPTVAKENFLHCLALYKALPQK